MTPTLPLVERLRDDDACWTPQFGYDIMAMRDLMWAAAVAIEVLTAERDALAQQVQDLTEYIWTSLDC